MKITQRLLAFLLSLLFLFTLCSCDASKSTKGTAALVDQTGRNIVLEKEAERVVSCYYVSTYAMLSLGLGDRLVGIEKKADTRPIYRMTDPSLLDLPAVGSMKEIDVELIASLEPDLVVLPKKLADSAEALETLGIQTLIVNPETDEELREMLMLLGKACGAVEQAEKLIDFDTEKLNGFAPSDEQPSVLFCANSSYLSAAPSGMYQSDLISLAGGTNAFGETEGSYWTEISYETILKLDPDYIVIPAGASYTADDLCADEVLSDLKAVRENQVVTVPNVFEEWDSPIPSGVLGVLWLRTVLHPADCSIDSFREDVTEFYETFYGFTPDPESIAALG